VSVATLKSSLSGRAILSVAVCSGDRISKYRILRGGALSKGIKDKDGRAVILKPRGLNT